MDCVLPSSSDPAWAASIASLSIGIRDASLRRRWQAPGDAWAILGAALRHYIDVHSRKLGSVGEDDRWDIASEKTLDFLCKIRSGRWDPSTVTPDEIRGLVSTLARNGLVDHLRKRRRQSSLPTLEGDIASGPACAPGYRGDAPGDLRERRAFAVALKSCTANLTPFARTVLYLRVFEQLPSKVVAKHPSLDTTAGNIDTTMLRCRDRLRSCMRSKGYGVLPVLPGLSTEIWDVLRSLGVSAVGRRSE